MKTPLTPSESSTVRLESVEPTPNSPPPLIGQGAGGCEAASNFRYSRVRFGLKKILQDPGRMEEYPSSTLTWPWGSSVERNPPRLATRRTSRIEVPSSRPSQN